MLCLEKGKQKQGNIFLSESNCDVLQTSIKKEVGTGLCLGRRLSLGCSNKIPKAYEQQKFLRVLETGSLRSGCQYAPGSGKSPSGYTLQTSQCALTWQRVERGRELSPDPCRNTNPIHGCFTLRTLSTLNYLPRAPTPNTQGTGFQHMKGRWGE